MGKTPQLPYYTPMPDFDKMTPDQLRRWLEDQIEWLQDKQRREANYLQGRAARQKHSGRGPTTTDDAYNKD